MPMLVDLRVDFPFVTNFLLCCFDSMGFGRTLGFTPYNDWWKRSRRLFPES
jgi:hypothetical protein